MRFPLLTAALAALTFALPTTAQDVKVYGGQSQRACSTLVLFGDNIMAGITVTHGQPEWKAEYDGMLDKLKGKLNRLGKDMWTTLLNSVDIEIGGTKIPAGSWVVGLHCDQDGKFALAFLDATKAMKEGTMPFGPQKWTPDHVAPLELKKDVATEAVQKMEIKLQADEKDPMHGTVTLAWGKHQLVGQLAIHAGK
ncbi:MAG: DUF2911 domain-containing protein [Planctomycetes bacterium]|nr:DUF2911 domain-containing protein [Planctomycetota bacterium]